ncbi:ABC transporter permease subunit [Chengkuizengella sediminis]|uniref:ABC transporter permease subunit n=1 Tax=Chengkuizengella sediminis TaxID=1885917 RepID=UPI001389FAB0|nr:ABC transporter permease subunit [Chengkuizengella sediminis]NDI33901.1 copper ABC transporter permease [Chengkuizengella sediminis]
MTYIWKEWKEQYRGKGLWLSLCMIIIVSIVIFLQTKGQAIEQGFEIFLLSIYDMNVYILPLLCLFLSSFAIMQEKELKTLMMLITKKESYRSFLLKKSIAVQFITISVLIVWYFSLAIPMKIFFVFQISQFIYFLLTVIFLMVIFNQIGLFLGSICNTRMQLVGANIFTWFLCVFLVDLIFIYILPSVSYQNVKIFSFFYFIDPLHSIRFFFETSIGLISLNHMSKLLEKFLWLSPFTFLIMDLFIWVVLIFELTIWLRKKESQI